MTVVDECPGCGYPKFGPDLCAYCVPLGTLTFDAVHPGDDAPEGHVEQANLPGSDLSAARLGPT